MIPDGWSELTLDDLIGSIDAGTSANCENRPAQNNEIGVLKTSAVSYGVFDPNENKVVLPEETDRVTLSPQKDTIIICRSNTPELVGANAYIDRDYDNLFLPDTLWRLSRKDSSLSLRWLGYLLNTFEMRWRIQNIATGTSANMKKISMRNLRKLKVICPPPAEQRAIAAILSTWDEAITLTQRLIVALQERQRGLMQRLLTGAVRFLEFAGSEWEEYRLRELVELTNGRAFKPEDWGTEGLPIIRIQNLNGSPEFNYYDQEVEKKYYINSGDLLFAWSGSRGTSFGPFIWPGPMGILNQHIYKVEPIANISLDFLYFALLQITTEIEQRAHGTHIPHQFRQK